MASDPRDTKDFDLKTIVEPTAATDTIQQKVEEPSHVTDFIQQVAEDSNGLKDITQQTNGHSAVSDVAKEIAEQKVVADVTRDTSDDLNTETDVTQQIVKKQSIATDGDELTEESLPDAGLNTTDKLNDVKDDTRDTTDELGTFDSNSQQTKEISDEADSVKTKFGYVKVSWEIVNFFMLTEKEEWEISSPEFDVEGFCITRWRLMLRAKKSNEDNNQNVFMCLERLDGKNVTRNVRVCWNVWFKTADEKLHFCNRENSVKSNCLLEVPIKNFEQVKKSLQVSLFTAACIEGLILVRSTENGEFFKKFEDLGLERLSEEISVAYRISQQSDLSEYNGFSDLKIKTGEYSFNCHKSILSARNKTLDEAIHKTCEKPNDIELAYSMGKAGGKILQYLYSGDLAHILRKPSISIHKAIKYLDVDELKCYYAKDLISLQTRLEAEEFYFKWIVMDINSSENFLYSPVFSREESGLALRLRLGLKTDEPKITSLSLKLDVLEENQVPVFYFMSGIANNLGEIISRRVIQWSSEGDTEIVDFTSKSVTSDPSITGNGYLAIMCSIFIPKGTEYQSVAEIQKCLRPEVDLEKHYLLLSRHLQTLFETGKHADLFITCQKEIFNVHKCVLFVRSPIFRQAIRNMRNLEGETSKGLTMHEFDPKVLSVILRYIYSGILDCDAEDLGKVYRESIKLSMVTLQYQSYNLLLCNLNASNALEALFIGVENADYQLVDSVCNFLKNNIAEDKFMKNWKEILEKKEALYEKLKDYERSHSELNENV